MRTLFSVFRAAASVVLMAGAIIPASAQGDEQRLAEAKAQTASYLRYFKFESKFSAKDIDRLAELRMKVHSPSTSLEDRQAALKEFVTMLFRAAGTNPMPPEQALENFAKNNGQAVHRLVNDSGAKQPGGSTPLGNLGAVEKRGRGPVPMILIADIRTDWSLYKSFMERNADRYTMYAVTLPGYGGSPAPPRPATLDLTITPWWDGAEKGVLNMIEKNKIDKPVVVGISSSSYLAARFALNHPDKVRGAVLIDGIVYTAFARSLVNPDYPATLTERPKVVAKQPGAIGMIQEFNPHLLSSRESTEARVKAAPPNLLPLNNVRTTERARELATDAAANSDPRAYRYNTELFTTDLSGDFGKLRVPMLALTVFHDDNSPGQGGPGPAEWNEMKLKYPSIPLKVLQVENTRSYLTEETPQELDKAIAAFVAGKPVDGWKAKRELAARPSPRASAMQAIGATEIIISYGRPQVNKRPIWGQLVPYNRVWRTGANEATEIAFSSDVLIEGQKLAAGRYTLATIPTETEWTIIFNRVVDQWGSFYYNPEFDALRIKVKPQPAEHQEWLSYGFDLLSANATNVVIQWEKVKALFKVELEPAKPASSGN